MSLLFYVSIHSWTPPNVLRKQEDSMGLRIGRTVGSPECMLEHRVIWMIYQNFERLSRICVY